MLFCQLEFPEPIHEITPSYFSNFIAVLDGNNNWMRSTFSY